MPPYVEEIHVEVLYMCMYTYILWSMHGLSPLERGLAAFNEGGVYSLFLSDALHGGGNQKPTKTLHPASHGYVHVHANISVRAYILRIRNGMATVCTLEKTVGIG